MVNVPARGVGKGVMESLQAIDPAADRRAPTPLLAAGLAEAHSPRSLWARLVYAVDENKLEMRAPGAEADREEASRELADLHALRSKP